MKVTIPFLKEIVPFICPTIKTSVFALPLSIILGLLTYAASRPSANAALNNLLDEAMDINSPVVRDPMPRF
jgi:hypothetical protein